MGLRCQRVPQSDQCLARFQLLLPAADQHFQRHQCLAQQDAARDHHAACCLSRKDQPRTGGQHGQLQDLAQQLAPALEAVARKIGSQLRARCIAPDGTQRDTHLALLPMGLQDFGEGGDLAGLALRLHLGLLGRCNGAAQSPFGEPGEADEHQHAGERHGAEQRMKGRDDEQVDQAPRQVDDVPAGRGRRRIRAAMPCLSTAAAPWRLPAAPAHGASAAPALA